ncbi:MAG: acyl-CoA dehydrogenase [Thermoanaerobaculia bacterium]
MDETTAGSNARTTRSLDDLRLLPFLPALYLAWSDGELTRAETAALCGLVDASEGLDASCRELLGGWLDPERPPSAAELVELHGAIRRAGRALEPSDARSLPELAAALAAAQDRSLSPPEAQALIALEAAFGLRGAEVGRGLLSTERPLPAAAPEPRALPAADLARWLDGPERATRERVRGLLAQPAFAPPLEAGRQELREWTLAACRLLAEHGLGALSFPPAFGGGGDAAGFVAAFETLAFGDLGVLVKFGVQYGLFGGSVRELGSERHHRELLPRIATLELPGCFAMTETGHGSNVAEIETTATFDAESDELVVHTPRPSARKDYIGNAAAHGRLATVFAQLVIAGERHGVHAVLVPIRDGSGRTCPGVTIEDCGPKLGLNGVDNGRLLFEQVRVPRGNLLDRFAQLGRDGSYSSPIASPAKRFFTMLGTLVGGRVSVGLAALSAAKKALALAVRYGGRRRQFGPPGAAEKRLLDYPSYQRRLLPALATTYGLHFALRALAVRYAAPARESDSELESLAAGLKALATAHATATIQACREACGGQGYLAVNRFAALKADTDVFTTFEGDNTVLLQLVAKHLLSGYRQQFGNFDAGVLFNYFLTQARSALVERNPIATHRTDESHLLDRDFHRAAFRWREEHLVGTLARRLRGKMEAGSDPFDALVECQDHALAAARAHVERHVLGEFASAVAAAPAELAPSLSLLCDLYALTTLERERGAYLEAGYFAAEKSKAIRSQVDRLCREVRRLALSLVDAFGIPEACLDAPIARR